MSAEESRRGDGESGADRGIASALWLRHLKLQSRVTAFAEAKSFLGSPEWSRARHVLELGASYGQHLHELARRHPEKSFTGLDLNVSAVELARTRFVRSNLTFAAGDLYRTSLPARFDFILSKSLLPHLADLEKFFAFSAAHLRPGGALTLLDACDDLKRIVPAVPTLARFYRRLLGSPRHRLQTRVTFHEVPRTASRFGFSVSREVILAGYTDSEFSKHDFAQTLSVNAECLAQLSHVPLDVGRLHTELSAWVGEESAFGSVGIHVITLAKS